jgi:heat shock protein HtpX
MRTVNNLKTAALMGFLIGLCMAIGYFVIGPRGAFYGLAFGGLMNLIAYFYSDRIALAVMQAREVPPEELPWLHEMVERLALRAGLPKPRIYVCPQPAPNAFATGRNPHNAAVAVTLGLLRGFPAHEIEGVLAHELAHIKHRDVLISTIAATLAGLISYAAYSLMYFGGGRDRDNPLGAIGALLTIILAPIAAMLIQAAISRQREFAADSYGGELCGDPNKLAAALLRLAAANERIPTEANPAFYNMFIVEPLSAEGLAGWFATHPPIEQRVAALRRQALGR